MNIRASQIYVSREVRRALSIIARAEGGDSTADSVGDRCLSEYVASRYPALTALQNKVKDVESEMVEAVKSCGAAQYK